MKLNEERIVVRDRSGSRRRGVRVSLLACAVLGAVVLAGCSSSSASKSKSSPTSGGSSSGTASGTPVKVGFIGGLSGSINYPDRLSSVKAAVAGINSRKGLAGHPIDLVVCDDKNTANDATACAREMVSNKVVAVAGSSSATQDALVTSILTAAGIPQIGVAASSAATLNSSLNYEPLGAYRLGYAVVTAYGAKKLNGPVSAVEFSVPAIAAFVSEVTAALKPAGIAFGNTVSVQATTADYSTLVAAASRGGAKSALFAIPKPNQAQFIKTDAATGSGLTYLSADAYSLSDAAAMGGVAQLDRVVTVAQLPPASAAMSKPIVQQYVKEMAAEQARGDANAALDKQEGGMIPWFGLYALEQVVSQTKTTDITAAGLVSALNGAKNIDLGGLLPNWTPRAPGIAGYSDVSTTTFYLYGYKNGEPYLITPNGVTMADAFAGRF